MRRITFAVVLVVLAMFSQGSRAIADALYPAASDGTWTGDTAEVCDTDPWTSPRWSLWAIAGSGQTYVFDIPNPTLVPGETLTIKLAPIVAGTVPGTVSLIGSDTVTVRMPDEAGQYPLTPQPFFQLAYVPGRSTVGTVPLPSAWIGKFTGFVGVAAQLTGDRGTNTHVAILAQGLRSCAGPAATSTIGPGSDGTSWVVPFAVLLALGEMALFVTLAPQRGRSR